MELSSPSYRHEMSLLVKLSTLINSSLNIDEVLENALDCVEEFLRAEVSSIFEVDRAAGELFFRLARGARAGQIKGLRLQIGAGIAGWVAQTEKPLICNDPGHDPRFYQVFDARSGFQTRSILCVPLKARDQLMGVLELLNKRDGGEFTDSDLELLTILGNQIGIALENARLYQRLNDKLTVTQEELKIAEKKLIRAERLAALGKIAQGVAHEVRNPVLIIGGFTHRLQKLAPEQDKVQEICGLILAELDKLSRMVKEIEQFARLPEPRRQPLALGAFVAQILEEYAPTVASEGIRLESQIDPDLPPVLVDAGLMRLALHQVLDNAREAMPGGGVVAVTVHATPTQVELTIKDSGVGIDAADQPYIFDPFFSTKPQGTGMGLTTVHRIISDHQGTVRLRTHPGAGTEVTLALPRWLDY